uniref:Uncharacterized protein n=1 Tax=blood disease bacterium R229 TaxID=741978 RepID=G2ZVY3_9RALS|nr:hypothetical protein BDB_mp60430 [blood disease bacterium R229]
MRLRCELDVEVFVEGELSCLVEHNPVGFVESTAIQGGLVECQQGRAVLAGQFGDSELEGGCLSAANQRWLVDDGAIHVAPWLCASGSGRWRATYALTL